MGDKRSQDDQSCHTQAEFPRLLPTFEIEISLDGRQQWPRSKLSHAREEETNGKDNKRQHEIVRGNR